MTKSVLLVGAALSVLVGITGCSKKEEGGAAGAASASAAASAGAPAAKAAGGGAGTADDPVVCCKFGGVKGSSTKKACETGKGTVVPDSECPTLKK